MASSHWTSLLRTYVAARRFTFSMTASMRQRRGWKGRALAKFRARSSERVAYLVGHHRRNPADGGQALGADEFALQALLLGHVQHDSPPAHHPPSLEYG